MTKKFTVDTIADGDDVLIPFPPKMLEELGWVEGDKLQWHDNGDGSFSITKKVEKVETSLVLVETISMFRMRYVVEVPSSNVEWATDTVLFGDAKEFSQKHLDETVVSYRAITAQEAMDLCNVDNDYAINLSNEQKANAFITPWVDDKPTD